jgi:hypothetical protein
MEVTRLEFFASQAPEEIPNWFNHEPPARTHKNCEDDINKLCDVHQKEVRDWQRDPCFDLSEELHWLQVKIEKYWDDESEWKDKNIQERYFQWRIFYATQMCLKLNYVDL